METEQQKRLRTARRIVIKLGTGIVTGSDAQFNSELLEAVAHVRRVERPADLGAQNEVVVLPFRSGSKAIRASMAIRQPEQINFKGSPPSGYDLRIWMTGPQ